MPARLGLRLVALVVAGVLGLGVSLRLLYPQVEGFQHLASGFSGPVTLPWQFWEVSNGNMLSVHLPANWLTPRQWNIIPDDHLAELRINGQPVPLSGVRPGGLNDWRNGFDIDLSPWLHEGDNTLEFRVDNYLGVGSLVLHPRLGWRTSLLFASLLPWLLLCTHGFRLPPQQIAILGVALAVLAAYWAATPWTDRNYDVKRLNESGHIGYVAAVAAGWKLPPPDQGWDYFQPPLYYVAGAAAWRAADALGISPPEALQALALLCWLLFLTASVATLRLTLGRTPGLLAVATAALALWPAGIIHSVRIGNDPPFYAAAAVATLLLCRWWRSRRRGHLLGAAAAIAAALLCKSGALVLVGAALALVAMRLLLRRPRLPLLVDASLACGVITAGAALSLARNVWYWHQGKMASWLIGNIGTLDDSLRVRNSYRNFLPLDVPTFLASPWLNTRDDGTGRSNFWNFLLRSSLTGEFSFNGAIPRFIALYWGWLLLGLCALTAAKLLTRRPPVLGVWRNMPMVMIGLLWLAASLALRLRYPFSCEADLRLVLPLLLPLIVLWVRQGATARALLAGISFGSVVFFLGL